MWRLRILLKLPAPRESVGMGPDIKTSLPDLLKRLKRSLKSALVSSDVLLDVSFEPMCTIRRVMEGGSERSSSGSFSSNTTTVAPGKHRVSALKNRVCLMMESPTIKVVGAKRGRGEDGCVLRRGTEGLTLDVRVEGGCGRAASLLLPASPGGWKPPERLSTASLRIFLRADEDDGRAEGCLSDVRLDSALFSLASGGKATGSAGAACRWSEDRAAGAPAWGSGESSMSTLKRFERLSRGGEVGDLVSATDNHLGPGALKVWCGAGGWPWVRCRVPVSCVLESQGEGGDPFGLYGGDVDEAGDELSFFLQLIG